jgi:hypothetical protein
LRPTQPESAELDFTILQALVILKTYIVGQLLSQKIFGRVSGNFVVLLVSEVSELSNGLSFSQIRRVNLYLPGFFLMRI